jgi:hypothetical protein
MITQNTTRPTRLDGCPGGELLHEPATVAGGEPLVDPGLLQTLGDGLVEHYGDDEADHQHDQGADQLR